MKHMLRVFSTRKRNSCVPEIRNDDFRTDGTGDDEDFSGGKHTNKASSSPRITSSKPIPVKMMSPLSHSSYDRCLEESMSRSYQEHCEGRALLTLYDAAYLAAEKFCCMPEGFEEYVIFHGFPDFEPGVSGEGDYASDDDSEDDDSEDDGYDVYDYDNGWRVCDRIDPCPIYFSGGKHSRRRSNIAARFVNTPMIIENFEPYAKTELRPLVTVCRERVEIVVRGRASIGSDGSQVFSFVLSAECVEEEDSDGPPPSSPSSLYHHEKKNTTGALSTSSSKANSNGECFIPISSTAMGDLDDSVFIGMGALEKALANATRLFKHASHCIERTS
jgi:hypothetical protein